MRIRPLEGGNHTATVALLVDTFRRFVESYARSLLGGQVFQHLHGEWEQDYRDEVPRLHAPASARHTVVSHLDDGTITGLVPWRFDPKPPTARSTRLRCRPVARPPAAPPRAPVGVEKPPSSDDHLVLLDETAQAVGSS